MTTKDKESDKQEGTSAPEAMSSIDNKTPKQDNTKTRMQPEKNKTDKQIETKKQMAAVTQTTTLEKGGITTQEDEQGETELHRRSQPRKPTSNQHQSQTKRKPSMARNTAAQNTFRQEHR